MGAAGKAMNEAVFAIGGFSRNLGFPPATRAHPARHGRAVRRRLGLWRAHVQQRCHGAPPPSALFILRGCGLLTLASGSEHVVDGVVHGRAGELQQRGGGVDRDADGEGEREHEHLHGVEDRARASGVNGALGSSRVARRVGGKWQLYWSWLNECELCRRKGYLLSSSMG